LASSRRTLGIYDPEEHRVSEKWATRRVLGDAMVACRLA